MVRLPTPGQDSGTWGTILNDFLSVEHNTNGTLKGSGSLGGKVSKGDLIINVKDYGAAGNGTTDDANAIQSAINAANSGLGGTVYFPAGTYIIGTTLVLYGGIHLRGSGIGGDVYSSTDSQLPFRGTVLKLKNGTNDDLIRTANFSTLTGQASPSAYQTPARFGLHDLVLDGNKQNNTSGLPLRVLGKAYWVDHVVIQNGAAGGVYSEYGAGGYEMEAHWSDFSITDNAGTGLEWRGPHDSLFVNGIVARNDTYNGIYIVPGSYVGGEQFANIHVWGSHAYQWVIGTSNASFANCIADGPGGVQILASGNQWIGGSILGTNVPGQVAFTIGDGAARTVTGNRFSTRVYNYAKGSILFRFRNNATSTKNIWQINAKMGGNTRYVAGEGQTTATSSNTFPVTSITVNDASAFAGNGNVLIGDGTTMTTFAYTGVSGNTLTGVTGGSGTLNAGAAVFQLLASTASEWLEVIDSDNATGSGVFQTAQYGSSATQFFLNNVSVNVGTMTVRPNSSATAIQWLRNETSRTDMLWDNSGSAGIFNFRNSALIKGYKDDGVTETVRLDTANGAVQPGTASGKGGRIFSGSGAPTLSATAGDVYIRTDSPNSVNQRVYMCTGTTNWLVMSTASPMEVVASAMGFLWENYPRNATGSSSQLVSGTAYFSLFAAMPGKTLTSLAFDVLTAGSSQTLVRVAVVNPADGSIVAQSNDVQTNFQSTGIVTSSLTSSVSVLVPTAYYAVIISVGGTQPFLNRGNATNGADQYGANAFSFGRRTGQTDIPTNGPADGNGPALWVAGIGT